MKSTALIAALVGLCPVPSTALAGRDGKLVTKVASLDKADLAKPENAKADAAKAAAVVSRVAEGLAAVMPEIPDLPADTSSALVPYPELEKTAAMCPKKAKTKPAVMKLGTGYVLGKRAAATVVAQDVEHVIPKTVSQAQVATVVQAQMGDIQFCWNAVPKAQRVDSCTLQLRLSISDTGAVTDVDTVGPVPAPTQRCIAAAVSHWKFPAAETKTEIDYSISLRSL
jgi:hypothetical protein